MDKTMHLSSVALVTRPWLSYFFLDLARSLKRRYGSKVHFYVKSRSETDFYEPFVRDGTIDSVTFAGILHEENTGDVDPAVTLAKARAYEHAFGRTLNSVSACDKMLGAPFSIGGLHFPRSHFYKDTDALSMAAAYVRLFEFWEREFAQKSISVFLNGWTEYAVIAKKAGIPFRHLIEIGYENYCHWAADEYHENPLIKKKYDEIAAPSRKEAEIDQPYLSARLGNTARLRQFGTWSFLARTCYNASVNHLKAWLRKRKTGYPLTEEWKYNWRLFSQFREVLRTHRVKLAELSGTDFLYFPLAREPEVPYMMMSPEYFYQIPAITSVIRDLPVGWTLAVKEHVSAIGPRPDEFYDQIRYFKQTRLMDITERGVDCVREAKAVVTIAGSAGIEAAVAGKPVISFGRHNSYCFLPHVLVVTDEAQLTKYISDIVDNRIDLAKARRDGARFLDALVAASFDMRDFDWEHKQGYAPEVIEDAVDKLVESLALERPAKPSASPRAAVAAGA